MAGTQYSYSEGDRDWWTTFLARCEKQSKGYMGISLTNFVTSVVCAIAAGSVCEIDGAVFHFAAETSVSGSIATGLNYIICSVTGTSAEPYWSQAAPSTYDTAKQGFYTAAERYVAGCSSDGTKYNGKWVFDPGQQIDMVDRWLAVSLAVGDETNGNHLIYGNYLNIAGTDISNFPVNLPDKTLVTGLFVEHESAGGNCVVSLKRTPYNAQTVQTIFNISLSADTDESDETVNTAGTEIIDNENYSYYVDVSISVYTSAYDIDGIKIRYHSYEFRY